MYGSHSQSDITIIYKNENQACQAPIRNGEKCGEVKSLDILNEIHQFYENKVSKIKDVCSCPSIRHKIQILEDWVKDLTEQNTMLVQVVKELEQEASERVSLLEEKLRHSSKTCFEIMKTLQKDEAKNISIQRELEESLEKHKYELSKYKLKQDVVEHLDISVKDMREALTAEVADKHESMVSVKRELNLLEERCRQADKQAQFKDDIIKEMRKELKQYRSKAEHKSRKHSHASMYQDNFRDYYKINQSYCDKSVQVSSDLNIHEIPQNDNMQIIRKKLSARINSYLIQGADYTYDSEIVKQKEIKQINSKKISNSTIRKVYILNGLLQMQLDNDKFRFPCHTFMDNQIN